MKELKILFYAPFPSAEGRFFGGMSIFAECIKNNRKVFESHDLFVDFFNTERFIRADKNKGKVRLENFKNLFKIIKDLKRYIQLKQYDLLHINTSIKLGLLKDILMIKFIKRQFKGKIILHIHSCDLSEVFFQNSIINSYLVNFINNNIDKVIVLSKGFRQEISFMGIMLEKISVIYNFQDDVKTIPSIKSSYSKKQLLFLGLIDEKKGILDLIEAISTIEKDKYILNIAGKFNNNQIKDKIYKLIKEKHLNNNIYFLGYVKNSFKHRILIKSDILILPSYTEGFPLCILEGMAAGCGIISTIVGAIPEIIINGENGYLVSPGDTTKLSEIIDCLISDELLLNKIKSNNINDSIKYSFDKFIHNLVKIYTF